MKTNEYKDRSLDELSELSKEKRLELIKLKFRHSMGQLEKTGNLKKLRKEIARIETFARMREVMKNATFGTGQKCPDARQADEVRRRRT